MPYYDGIYADIGDEQGIAQNLSTFSSHLARIRGALARAGRHTLLLLDELGAGTDPVEGAALGYALLEELLARGIPTLASTHLGALKVFAYRNQRAENASVEFDPASLEPLYRLQIGLPGESNALRIARRLGFDEGILARAEAVLERGESGLDEVIEEVRIARTAAERSRARAKKLENRSKRHLSAARAARSSAEDRLNLLQAEADRVVEDCFRSVQRVLADFRPALGSLGGAVAESVELFLRRIEEAMDATPLGERRQAFLQALKPGAWIYVPKYRQRCAVRKVDHKRGEVHAMAGGMELQVPFCEVTWFETL